MRLALPTVFAATVLLLLLSAPVRAQYDPAAREPLRPLVGTVMLGGGGALP